ncbi:MAG: ABC-2 family transporter protein [Candidatus Abawacabacteria bacterium]|nr:ABC-2 family transporter protein [Candidatus Abawacabacteria bacterium]
MVSTLKSYLGILKICTHEEKVYYWDNILWSTRTFVEPLILLIFWGTIAHTQTTSSVGQTVIYFVFLALVGRLTSTWVASDTINYIQSGELSHFLLSPVPGSYIAQRIVFELNLKKSRLKVTIPLALIFYFVLSYYFSLHIPALSQLVFFPFAAISGYIITFFLWLIVASTTFWLYHSSGVIDLVDNIIPAFDGSLIPYMFLPVALVEIFQYLPFRYMLSFPLEIVSAPMTPEALWFGILMSLFWGIALILLTQIVWHKGLKAYQG